jgi:hypothetical protein
MSQKLNDQQLTALSQLIDEFEKGVLEYARGRRTNDEEQRIGEEFTKLQAQLVNMDAKLTGLKEKSKVSGDGGRGRRICLSS